MDYLDSIEVTTHRRSHRVRSWYLYEQFKSLEQNQIDAAQKLKDKSYQGRLLQQELSERRARRRLCGEFGLCDSELKLGSMESDVRSCVNSSNNDFYESFCEMQDEPLRSDPGNYPDCMSLQGDHGEPYPPDTGSRVSADEFDNEYKVEYPEDYEEEIKEDSTSPSPVSYIAKLKSDNSITYHATVSTDNLADDIKEELALVKKNIAENISIQRETVKENLQCLRDFTKLHEESNECEETPSSTKCDYKSSKYADEYEDEESICSLQCASSSRDEEESIVSTYSLWSKIVSFAYQVIQLNHVTKVKKYKSKVWSQCTKVEINRSCNRRNLILGQFLQPYVSPINYINNDTINCMKRRSKRESSASKNKNHFEKKNKHKCILSIGVKNKNEKSPSTITYNYGEKTCHSENSWQQHFMHKSRVKEKPLRIFSESEPWQCSSPCHTLHTCQKESSTIWPEDFRSGHSNVNFASCHTPIANPMAKVAIYMDTILQDIGSHCSNL